jgi:arsenate reductase (glutaredoxin)
VEIGMADADFPVTIYHNPECGTSRNVLAIIDAAGYRPNIVEYLATGWTRPQLLALFSAAGVTVREALREKKSPAEDLGLLDPSVSDERLLEEMLRHPVLVNRPFVTTPKGTRLCRPDSALVLDLLERWPRGPFAKEDGTPLIGADGKRAG